MPISDDLRKTLTDATPLYFAAGVLDKIREEAPERIAAVRATDPKEVQARVSKQAKETQAKVTETLGSIDTDIKKLREQAQHLALQGVGYAAEYAVKARETYDELAARGRGAVKNWRGESDDEAPRVTVEREPVKVAEPPAEPKTAAKSTGSASSATTGTARAAGSASATSGTSSAKKASAARRTTTARTTSKTTSGSTAESKRSQAQQPQGRRSQTQGESQAESSAKKTPGSDS